VTTAVVAKPPIEVDHEALRGDHWRCRRSSMIPVRHAARAMVCPVVMFAVGLVFVIAA
jgi:hypothetical protein